MSRANVPSACLMAELNQGAPYLGRKPWRVGSFPLLVTIALSLAILALSGCVADVPSRDLSSRRGDRFGTGGLGDDSSLTSPGQRDAFAPSGAGGGADNADRSLGNPSKWDWVELPPGFSENNSFAATMIATLGEVDYDGQTLPIVNPSGGYIAVQTGPGVPWATILARPDSIVPQTAGITIYRIQRGAADGGGRLTLVEHLALDGLGLLGRSADDEGFLVESPQPDDSRWIGKVSWESGKVQWLVRQGVNAFGVLGPGGRLAWCRRAVDEEHFSLYVQQADNEVFHLESQDGGDWMMPVWAGDAYTLFAFRVADDAPLEVVALNTGSQDLLQWPFATRPLVRDANTYTAYQTLAAMQEPIPWDGSVRLLFYHPGYGRMCIFEPARAGIRLLTRNTSSGVWGDSHSVVLASDDALFLQDVATRQKPVTLLKGRLLPRRMGRTGSSIITPYILLAPVASSPYRMQLHAMQIIESREAARQAERY